MQYKSTYLFKLCAVCLVFSSCGMQDLSDTTSYAEPEMVAGYKEARENTIRRTAVRQQQRQESVQSAAVPVQNGANIPVIINDPFAIGNSLSGNVTNGYANNPGIGNNVFYQTNAGLVPASNGNYSSLANSERQVITPNVLINNSVPQAYQQPSFGSNIYMPMRRY